MCERRQHSTASLNSEMGYYGYEESVFSNMKCNRELTEELTQMDSTSKQVKAKCSAINMREMREIAKKNTPKYEDQKGQWGQGRRSRHVLHVRVTMIGCVRTLARDLNIIYFVVNKCSMNERKEK